MLMEPEANAIALGEIRVIEKLQELTLEQLIEGTEEEESEE